MLNGQCKKDFNDWFRKEYSSSPLWDYWVNDEIPFSMQFGVYVDFFDSVGIYCEDRRLTKVFYTIVKYPNIRGIQDREEIKAISRDDARKQAILKANEIYNNKS